MNTEQAIAGFTGVSKHYDGPHGGTLALKDVTFTAHAGEMILLLGPSGSGKTTFLTLLAGLQGPTTGDVYLFGKKTVDYTAKELQTLRAEKIGFVFQTFYLLDSLTVLENVMLVKQFSNVGKVLAREASLRYLKRFGVDHLSDSYPNQISQGEKQRVALARALVNEATLIFADEPTGSLASRQGMEIVEFLKKSVKEENRCVIITSHDERIVQYADRVYQMEDGEVVAGCQNKITDRKRFD